MLQPSEYRIGNLVSWNPALRYPESTLAVLHVEIAAILYDKIGYISPNIEHRSEPFEDDQLQKELHYRSFEELTPIILTPEIMRQSGFTDNRLEISFDGAVHFLLYSNSSVAYHHSSGLVLSKSCSYLHQLQNLYFSITGEELNIDSHSLMG